MPSHPKRDVKNNISFVPLVSKGGGAAYSEPHPSNGNESFLCSLSGACRTRPTSPLPGAVVGRQTEPSNSSHDLGTEDFEEKKNACSSTAWQCEHSESGLPCHAVDGEGEEINGSRDARGHKANEGKLSKDEKRTMPQRDTCETSPTSSVSGRRGTSPLLSLAGKPAGGEPVRRISLQGRSSTPISLDEKVIPTLSPLFDRLPPAVSMPSPHHWSVFYPDGIDSQPPLLLHYLSLGGWRTVAGGWDYFSHRRLQDGEVIGHDVRWLHSARPRDRFVFLISPVEPKADDESVGRWHKFRDQIYGPPPCFAYRKGKLFKRPPFGPSESVLPKSGENASVLGPVSNSYEFSSSATESFSVNAEGGKHRPCKPHIGRGEKRDHRLGATMNAHSTHNSTAGVCGKATAVGVEVIEVRHEDITATDYSPRLSSSRFAIESKAVYAYYFSTLEGALTYYDCLDDLRLMEEQTLRGVTNRMPCRPKRDPYKPSQSLGSATIENGYKGDGLAPAKTMNATPRMDVVGMGKETPLPSRKEMTTELLDLTITDRNDVSLGEQTELLPLWNEGQTSLSSLPESPNLSRNTRQVKQRHQYDRSIQHLIPVNTAAECAYGPHGELHHPSYRDVMTPFSTQRSPSRDHAVASEPSIRPRLLPTLTTAHFDTIITVYSEDPNFNAVLREVLMPDPGTHPYTVSLKEQRRMLSMYETGMPAWTIFLASTGLPYRRVFRLIFVGLVNIWPLISLFVGLYDLYKHLPRMKTFVATTLSPLLEWIEEHVTFRLSMLTTYIISVGVTVAASFTSFFSQFYLLELFIYPLRILGRLLQTPFSLVFELLWSIMFIIGSFLRLLFVTLKMIFAGPFLLVTHLSSWEFSSTPVLPAAVEGTSLTMKWWRAWQEFWVTVASPVKNLAKAWYDSVVHVAVSAARREASIRRWYTPRLRYCVALVAKVREICAVNLAIFWQLCGPGWGLWLLYSVLFTCTAYLLITGERGGLLDPHAMFGVIPSVVNGEGGGEGFIGASASAAAATESGELLKEHPPEFPGTATTPMVRSSQAPLFRRHELEIEDNNGNGFDALFFAWETIIAVWVQLPW
ncbi:hypothetical protein TcBrA4_0117050 [Trypanosoma cruzi]|nr:hypothetical protein TcBrA4_0117050 [Trypanosoma cruzi]